VVVNFCLWTAGPQKHDALASGTLSATLDPAGGFKSLNVDPAHDLTSVGILGLQANALDRGDELR
jgi:hypothetical protein